MQERCITQFNVGAPDRDWPTFENKPAKQYPIIVEYIFENNAGEVHCVTS